MNKDKNVFIEIGTKIQLLIDDYVIDDIWMVRRAPEMPVKYLNNPIFTEKGLCEGESKNVQSVMYDKEEKIFKMWYTYHITDKDMLPPGKKYSYMSAYAVSHDGINWEMPELGIVEYRGTKRNNIYLSEGIGWVMKDRNDPDPQKKYKMICNPDSGDGSVYSAFSADGLRWNRYPGNLRASRDGSNRVVYDEKLGKYVMFRRPTILACDYSEVDKIGFQDNRVMKNAGGDRHNAPKGVGFPSEDDFVLHEEAEDYMHRYLRMVPYVNTRALRIYNGPFNVGCNRRIARAESDDFINWTEPEVVIRPDELDPPRLYNIGVSIYNGMYIGALQVFNSWGFRRYPGCPQESEVFEVQLTFSRDGKKWERLANRPVFIPRGYIGSFDGGMIMTADSAFIEYMDDLYIYYNGRAACHNVGCPAEIGVAKLPKERIVARVAGDELGALITKPFVLEGKKLEINANSLKGLIKVEVTDSIGQPIKGFNVMDCEEIRRNEFRIPVEWKSGKKLEDILGQHIRLRFYMSQSKLYSFKFSN